MGCGSGAVRGIEMRSEGNWGVEKVLVWPGTYLSPEGCQGAKEKVCSELSLVRAEIKRIPSLIECTAVRMVT